MNNNTERVLSAQEKTFLMRTVKFLIDEKQISQGRQLIMRYFDNGTFSDEDYAQIEEWTDAIVNLED